MHFLEDKYFSSENKCKLCEIIQNTFLGKLVLFNVRLTVKIKMDGYDD